MNNIAVQSRKLCKNYRIYKNAREKWMDLLLPGSWGTDFAALQNLTFQIKNGEAVGLIGRNGSGKSTLSNLIAGISRPSSGNLEVKGDVSMIAVGAGLSGGLTGLENIELKGLLIGLTRAQIRSMTPQIIDFAEIGEYITQPVRTYSSGMRARLAFAISININPDILVIDEGFAVGDSTFVDRCLERVRRFRENGKTMIFTGHSSAQLRSFCDRLLWLEAGSLLMDDDIQIVMKEYADFTKWLQSLSAAEQRAYVERTQRWRSYVAERDAVLD